MYLYQYQRFAGSYFMLTTSFTGLSFCKLSTRKTNTFRLRLSRELGTITIVESTWS